MWKPWLAVPEGDREAGGVPRRALGGQRALAAAARDKATAKTKRKERGKGRTTHRYTKDKRLAVQP